jgi:hypothetical protein
MSEDYILLEEDKREELKKAYDIIKKVKNDINTEYEEYVCLEITLDYLNVAIRKRDYLETKKQ